MRAKDLGVIAIFGVAAAIVSYIVASSVFKPPAGSTQVPEVSAINPNFPDIKNDSKFNTIFNNQALDPTQPVQIGSQNNTVPFR
jgi:hypothetical protein